MKKRNTIASWKQWMPEGMTLLSALLIVVSFAPWNLWPLIWISLIPWFMSLEKAAHPKAATIQGFWLCFFMTMGCFHWVSSALEEYGSLPWIVGMLGLILFGCFNQSQFIVFAWFHKKLEK